MIDRRASAPIQVHQQEPPERSGRLHTVRFDGRGSGDAELWLAKQQIAVGYLYEAYGTQVISYFEADVLEVVA
jgi:hypothetical protein